MTIRCAVALLLTMVLTGCNNHAGAVCEAVGDCSEAGSSDWISQCVAEGDLLMNESQAIGCSTQFDAYFSCADAKYVCTGNVARFAGCADSRARLDACLAKATADTGCAQLAAAVMACPGFDAGVVPGSCSVTRSCESRCVLASEQNVCAPQLAELQAFIDCAKSCP